MRDGAEDSGDRHADQQALGKAGPPPGAGDIQALDRRNGDPHRSLVPADRDGLCIDSQDPADDRILGK